MNDNERVFYLRFMSVICITIIVTMFTVFAIIEFSITQSINNYNKCLSVIPIANKAIVHKECKHFLKEKR